jgi:hypothetical protein
VEDHRGKDRQGLALPSGVPGYKSSYDISPMPARRASKGFENSWRPTIEPKGVADRRGGGKVSFLWYRTNLTVPAKIGDFETAGVLTAYGDDYAESGSTAHRAGITSPAPNPGIQHPEPRRTSASCH